MFLPQLAAANSAMDAELRLNPTSYNMEEVEGVDGPLIEMVGALLRGRPFIMDHFLLHLLRLNLTPPPSPLYALFNVTEMG